MARGSWSADGNPHLPDLPDPLIRSQPTNERPAILYPLLIDRHTLTDLTPRGATYFSAVALADGRCESELEVELEVELLDSLELNVEINMI